MKNKMLFTFLVILLSNLFSPVISATLVSGAFGWKSSDVSYIMSHKSDYLNNSASFLYDAMKERGMEVRFVATHGTSPFTDPEGKSYLTQVVLFSADITKAKKGSVFYRLVVTVCGDEEEWLTEERTVWRSINKQKDWIDELLRITGTELVKDITLEEQTWNFD